MDIAAGAGLEDTVKKDFDFVKQTIRDSRELVSFLKSPVIQNRKKVPVLLEIFQGKLNDLTMNFIRLLVEKSREDIIPEIIEEFEKEYNYRKKVLPVEFISVVEMDEELKKKLIERMENLSGKKVLPEFRLDASLKGGFQIKVNDWFFDASVRHQLEKLHAQLAAGHGI